LPAAARQSHITASSCVSVRPIDSLRQGYIDLEGETFREEAKLADERLFGEVAREGVPRWLGRGSLSGPENGSIVETWGLQKVFHDAGPTVDYTRP
jgi:hypothetical protein